MPKGVWVRVPSYAQNSILTQLVIVLAYYAIGRGLESNIHCKKNIAYALVYFNKF